MPVALCNLQNGIRRSYGDDFRYLIVNKLKKLGGNVDTGAVSRGGLIHVHMFQNNWEFTSHQSCVSISDEHLSPPW